MQSTGIGRTARRTLAVVRHVDVATWSAALAYYGLVSVMPLTLLLMAAAAAVGEGDAAVAGTLASSVSPSLRPLLADAVDAGVRRRQTASIVGGLFLAWGATRVFAGLDAAFADVHGAGDRWGRYGRFVAAAVALGSIALAVSVLAGLTIAFAAVTLPGEPLIRQLAPFAVVTLGLTPLYAVLSPDDLGLREVLPGAAVAAAALAVLRSGFESYVALSGALDVYGLVGGVLLLALWLYLGAAALLVGACVNEARRGVT